MGKSKSAARECTEKDPTCGRRRTKKIGQQKKKRKKRSGWAHLGGIFHLISFRRKVGRRMQHRLLAKRL